MRKIWMMFAQMIKQIGRDYMLLMLCIAPVLAGLVFRFGVPVLERFLCDYFSANEILAPYYYIFNWLLAVLPGLLFAFVGGLVALGEIDDKIAGYMEVTPAGNTGYLISRIGIPSLFSMVAGVAVIAVFGLSSMKWTDILVLCAGSSLTGTITALLVIAISTNKVEGMAIGKLAGFLSIGMFVPVIFASPIQYVAGVLPTFWMGKYMLEGHAGNLLAFAAVYLIWLVFLMKKYRKKICL